MSNEKKEQKQNVNEYMVLAAAFLKHCNAHNLNPLCVGDRVYFYKLNRYVEVKNVELELRRFCLEEKIPQKNTLIQNALPIFKAKISTYYEDKMPFWINSYENAMDIIPFKNGLLNLKTMELGSHTAAFVSTSCLPFNYDKDAECNLWKKTLNTIYEGNQEKINLLQEWMGYCLSEDTSMQKLMFLIGVPRSGKGTISRMLKYILGENACGFELTSLASPYGTSALIDKQVALVGELELDSNRRKVIAMLNSIVGEDDVPLEKKYKDRMSGRLNTRFTISANEMPVWGDTQGALGHRMLVLEHNYHVQAEERDPNLGKKLQEEASGIINWALEGLSRLLKNGKFSDSVCNSFISDMANQNSNGLFEFLENELIFEKGRVSTMGQHKINLTYVDEKCECPSVTLKDAFASFEHHTGFVQDIRWFRRELKNIVSGIDYDKNNRKYLGFRVKNSIENVIR